LSVYYPERAPHIRVFAARSDGHEKASAPVNDRNTEILVGRSHERSLIQTQLSAAERGNGGLVILSGEAGVGKTTLTRDVCLEAVQNGALVLTGQCYDGANTPPYGPWAELLEQVHNLRKHAPGLPSASEPDLSRSTSQAAFFSEIRGFLNAIAQERPLVIVLEDMHWSDAASLNLLRVVARQIITAPILLLMTYRSDEVTRKHPLYQLLPVLVREALAVRIDLSPLRDDDVRLLIEHDYRLPGNEAMRLTHYVQAYAQGNPFFVSELLRALEGTALLETGSGAWVLGTLQAIEVPVLLQQVIDARLARLGDDADHVLSIASVIGEVVPLALWAKVCQMTEEALFPLIERATDARVFTASADGLTVHFAHALVREALYQRILPPRRRGIHREIGEALERQTRTPEFDEVAYHFSQAGDPRAVAWFIQAGERAQRAFAYRAAMERFESALALLEKDEREPNERGWLSFRLALLRRFQDPVSGVVRLVAAEQLGRETHDAALIAYAHYFQGMLRRMAGDFQQWITIAEEGIALLDALSDEDHARLAALATSSDPLDGQNGRGDLTLALGEIGPFARAVALGEQIISLPPEETVGSRGDAYYGLGYAYSALGRPDAARSAFRRAREIFRAGDHLSMVLATLCDELALTVLPFQADQPVEREQLEIELQHVFVALEDVFDPGAVRIAHVVSDVLNGNWADLLATVRQNSPRYIRLVVVALVAPLAREQGNPDLAWTLVNEGLPDGPETDPGASAGYIVPLRALAVQLALDAGDLDAARRWLDAFDRWIEWSGAVLGRADAHCCWAEYFRARNNRNAARMRATQALEAAGEPRQPVALLRSRRLQGELDLEDGQLEQARAHLDAALALSRACGARNEEAQTLLALASLSSASGDRSTARTRLATVRDLCAAMGATRILARVDEIENRLCATDRVDRVSLPAGLTPREAEVLRLLAAGLSNAEIADRLSLSPRTINAHLTNIYGKLSVNTRGAAIRFALDHGLS
jgi:DNA-binding CsgD family transcriptional regulator/tetratricopeptide (TPR) repeat protein